MADTPKILTDPCAATATWTPAAGEPGLYFWQAYDPTPGWWVPIAPPAVWSAPNVVLAAGGVAGDTPTAQVPRTQVGGVQFQFRVQAWREVEGELEVSAWGPSSDLYQFGPYTPVPEPSGLLFAGLVVLAALRWLRGS